MSERAEVFEALAASLRVKSAMLQAGTNLVRREHDLTLIRRPGDMARLLLQ